MGLTKIGQLMKATTGLYLCIGVCVLISSPFIMTNIEKSSLPEVEPIRVYYSNSTYGRQDLDIYSEKGNVKYEEFSNRRALFINNKLIDEKAINLLNYQLPTHRQARFTDISDKPK